MRAKLYLVAVILLAFLVVLSYRGEIAGFQDSASPPLWINTNTGMYVIIGVTSFLAILGGIWAYRNSSKVDTHAIKRATREMENTIREAGLPVNPATVRLYKEERAKIARSATARRRAATASAPVEE